MDVGCGGCGCFASGFLLEFRVRGRGRGETGKRRDGEEEADLVTATERFRKCSA